ncbi:16216_t:CDS:2, partial [Gigaspora margarita]
MVDFNSLVAHSGSKYSDEEWSEYVEMPQVCTNEISSEWMKQIWERLMYFRENNLLPNESKKYLEARRLIRLLNGGSYAPEIGIAICIGLLIVQEIFIVEMLSEKSNVQEQLEEKLGHVQLYRGRLL